jgi:predicted Fe-Mo cluster-binding NifX family protein
MQIVAAADGRDLGSTLSPFMASARTLVFVETSTMAIHTQPNPERLSSRSVDGETTRLLQDADVDAVVVGSVDAGSLLALERIGVPVYPVGRATVLEAIGAVESGRAHAAHTPTE